MAIGFARSKSGVHHGDAADLQVCAQCLEEMLGVDVPAGYIWYGGPRRRLRVPFTPELRARVRETVEAIRRQLLSGELPHAPNDERCQECQLRAHCLPEVTSAPRRISRYMAGTVFQCAI